MQRLLPAIRTFSAPYQLLSRSTPSIVFIRTMADDHVGLHKDPITGEMISKTYVRSSTLFAIDID